MNRPLPHLIGPEATLARFSVLPFWFCARHNSGEGRNVVIMERLIWAIPFILTPAAFVTICAPDTGNWWWLSRAIVFTFIAIFVCGYRLIDGMGSGPKGQDAAFILLIVLASVAIAMAAAVTGALILAATKPGFANWFQTHKFLASLLTFLSAVPIGFGLGIVVKFCSTILLAFYCEVFKR